MRRRPGGLLPLRGVDLGRRDAHLGRRCRFRRHRRQPHHSRRRRQEALQLVVRKQPFVCLRVTVGLDILEMLVS